MNLQHGIIIELGDRESGFLKPEKGEEKLFFHSDHLKEIKFINLKVGDKLSFLVRETRNGPYAIEVTKTVVKTAKLPSPTKAKAVKKTTKAK